MKLSKHLLCFVIWVQILSCSVLPSEPISLDSFLTQLKLNHPKIAQLRLNSDIGEQKKNASKDTQDWLFKSKLAYLDSEPLSIGFQTLNELKKNSFESSLNKLFWSTGGHLSFGFEANQNQVKRSALATSFMSDNLDKYTETKTYIQYKQPLFQNLGGKLFRYPYEQEEKNAQLSVLNAEESIEHFLQSMSDQFIHWRYLQILQNIAKKRLALAKKSYKQSQKRFKANVVETLDVLRSEAALNLAKQQLLHATSKLKSHQKQLSQASHMPELNSKYPNVSIYETYNHFKVPSLDSTRLMKGFYIQKSLIKQSQEFYIEQQKPDLNLSLYASLSSYDKRLADAFLLNYNDYQITIDYSVALGQTKTRANLEAFRLKEIQLEKDKKQSKLMLLAKKKALETQLKQLKEILRLNKKQVRLSKQVTTEELRLYNQGRTNIFQVIQAQDQEQQTQEAYAKQARNYQSLHLELKGLFDLIY